MRSMLQGTLVNGGIDWLTCTARPGDGLEKFRALAYSIAESELELGQFGRPWSASGYEGLKVGSLQYGEREDGAIMRLGSSVAHFFYQMALRVADNVTRIDLQSTWRTEEAPAVVITRHYRELMRKRRKMKRGPKVSFMIGHDGGRTCYSGRKISSVFGRIYDKGAESKLPFFEGCVRYEVQYNGDRARLVAKVLAGPRLPVEEIYAAPLEFLTLRGACLKNLREKLKCQGNDFRLHCPKAPTDTVRALEWLQVSVGPTVERLVQRGKLSAVKSSLRLA